MQAGPWRAWPLAGKIIGIIPPQRFQQLQVYMPSFRNGPVEIAYLDQGEGDPIVLVHGFSSTKEVNWVNTGWVETLIADGRRVIALDNRGHGHSTKIYDVEAYHLGFMADDVRALMDHVNVPRADVMGYSMGGRIATNLALRHPARVRSLIIGGIGMALIDGGGPAENVATALEAPSLADVTDPMGRTFRAFADQTGFDRRALAACLRGTRRRMSAEEVGGLQMPVLVAVGTDDEIAGSAAQLAALIPGAQLLDIPGRDHMKAVGDRVYKAGVLAFLGARP